MPFSRNNRSDFPDLRFIERQSQFDLWSMIPARLLNQGLGLFSQAAYDDFDASQDARKAKEVRLRFSGPIAVETVFREQREAGPLESRCGCEKSRYEGLCAHQVCLLLLLWRILNFVSKGSSAVSDLSLELSQRIQDYAEIYAHGARPDAAAGPKSIPRLESLILALPRTASLFGFSAPLPVESMRSAGHVFHEIPAAAPVRKSALRPRVVAQVRSSGADPFPPLLTASPRSQPTFNSYGYYNHHIQEEQALREALQYRFADGTVLNAHELLFHPYSLGIAPALLPTTTRVRASETPHRLPRLLTSSRLSVGYTLTEADQALAQVVLAAAALKIPVELTALSDRSSPRPALKLKECAGAPPAKLEFSVDLACDPPRATLLLASLAEEPPLLLGSFALRADGSLFFHGWDEAFSEIIRLIPARISSTEISAGRALDRSMTFEFRESLGKNTDQHIRELKRALTPLDGIQLTILPSSTRIARNAITPEIRLDSEGSFTILLRGPDGIDSELLPDRSPLMRLLTEGLGALTYLKNTDVATRRRGLKRERDLKTLRHQGIAHAIFQEAAQGALRGEKTQAILNAIDEKTALLLLKTEDYPDELRGGGTPRLSKLCSERVWELVGLAVRQCVTGLLEDETSTFSREGERVWEGLYRRCLELLLAWSEQLTLESRGASFLKSKIPLFGMLEAAAGPALYRSQDAKADAGFALRAFLPLAEKGFHLFVDGAPIETLNPLDFRPDFTLAEGSDGGTSGKIDWFELNPRFFFKGVEISAAQAQGISTEGVIRFEGKLYLLRNRELPSLKRLQLFWDRLAQGKSAHANAENRFSSSVYRLPRSQTLEILALRASGVEVRGGPRWQEICAFYDRLGEARASEPAAGEVLAELMPFQKIGIRWLADLYTLGLGGILADEMGLGKTLQTLAFLEHLRAQGELGPVLIVVPTSLTFNWASEAARFTPGLPIRSFQSRDKAQLERYFAENAHGVVICTYGVFTENQEFLARIPWNVHVFDEAQNLKNITAKRTTASRAVPARFKLCLTGTPLENHLGEFFSLMDLVVPGCLGDLDKFRSRYVLRDTVEYSEIQGLRLTIKPLILRRTKSQILKQLPEKSESTIKLVFDEQQKKIYRDVAVTWNEKIQEMIRTDGEGKSQLAMLTALLRLRQICSDPSSLPHVRYTGIPPKLSVLIEALEEITESGDSALVFTQFLHTLERVRGALEKAGIPYFTLHGAHTKKEREKTLQGFSQEPKGAVLLMTLKTGGVGLNLTKASYVFHLEPWWNPAVENQASDRAHRLGQEKAVQIFRYLMRDSVEEKIELLKDRKAARFNAMFANEENRTLIETASSGAGGSHLSKRDFEFLLGQ